MIEVKHLCKKYGNHIAIEDLNFTIESGHIYGLLGSNGAGKSTAMNIMTGCLAATSGQVLINGHDIFEDALEAKKHIGYLPEIPPLYPDMTPLEYLKFVARMKGLRGDELHQQIDKVMDTTGIVDVSSRLIKHLSKGYRQRVGLAQALLGHSNFVVLDEPTVGLDPKQIMEMRSVIKKLGNNRMVILSSHILSEVQAICDVVIIISKGRIVAIDNPENLERHFNGKKALEIVFRASPEEARTVLSQISGVSEVTCIELGAGRISATVMSEGGRDITEDISAILLQHRMPIFSMNTASVGLEDIFIELTKNEHSETEGRADQQ